MPCTVLSGTSGRGVVAPPSIPSVPSLPDDSGPKAMDTTFPPESLRIRSWGAAELPTLSNVSMSSLTASFTLPDPMTSCRTRDPWLDRKTRISDVSTGKAPSSAR